MIARTSRLNPAGLSRRQLLGAAGLAGAGLGLGSLTGCGPVARTTSGVGREIAFWHLMSAGDGARMDEIIADMSHELSDAQVKQTVLPWGPPYYTKLAMASAGGRAPDLGIMHLSRLAGYAPGGLLDPWDLERFAQYDVTEDTFSGPVFDRMHVDDELFAIALDSHVYVRHFNTEVADKAGLLDADGRMLPVNSVDGLVEQGLAMQEVTGDLGISYGFLGDAGNMWRLFWTFYSQQEATMTLEDGRFRFDEDAFVTAIETMLTIITSDAANPRSDGGFAFSTFTSGGSGMFLSGVWEVPAILDSGIPLDASPIPNLFGTDVEAVWGDSHAFVLPHQDHPDEETREKTYEAVSLILKHSLTWATAGHTPAYAPIVADPEFADLQPNANYAETADYVHYDPAVSFAGSGSVWQEAFGQVLQPTLLRNRTLAEAVESFVDLTDRFVEQAVNE